MKLMGDVKKETQEHRIRAGGMAYVSVETSFEQALSAPL